MKIRSKIILGSTVLVALCMLAIWSVASFIMVREADRVFRGYQIDWDEDWSPDVSGERIYMVYPTEDGIYEIHVMPDFDHVPEKPDSFMDNITRNSWALIAFSLLIILGLSSILTMYISRSITNPIDSLIKGAKRVEQNILDVPVESAKNDEFNAVCHAFNQMQQSLLAAQARARQVEEARTDMIAGISHDLRTPLTSVKGYIKGLQDGVATTPEKQARYLDVAYQRACDMDVLLQRLFYISQVDSGALVLQMESVDLGSIIEEFTREMTPELELLGGSIALTLPEAPCILEVDEGQIRRLLGNLTENAVKYANADPLMLRIRLEDHSDHITLFFADNGCGVPAEQLRRLYDRFWRGDASRGEKSGSGLGLYLVKHIVTSHGGSLEAQNDNGLQFTIDLPRKEGRTDG